MRELHDLSSFWRVYTALDNSRAVRASVSRMVVGVGVDEACCCCVLVSAVVVADSCADLSAVSSFFLLPNFQALQ